MGEGQNLEHGVVSGEDSRLGETPATHTGPFARNEEQSKKKQSWSRSKPVTPYQDTQLGRSYVSLEFIVIDMVLFLGL